MKACCVLSDSSVRKRSRSKAKNATMSAARSSKTSARFIPAPRMPRVVCLTAATTVIVIGRLRQENVVAPERSKRPRRLVAHGERLIGGQHVAFAVIEEILGAEVNGGTAGEHTGTVGRHGIFDGADLYA